MVAVFLIIISSIVNYQYTRTEIASICREIGKGNQHCEERLISLETAKKNLEKMNEQHE
jgi:hypothetical protein